MAIKRNPDGSQTRVGGSLPLPGGSPPMKTGAPPMPRMGYGAPRPVTAAPAPQQAPAMPAAGGYGGGGGSAWLEQQNRDHTLNSARTMMEKSQALGGATLMGPTGVVTSSPNVLFSGHTTGSGGGGGYGGGYGGGGGIGGGGFGGVGGGAYGQFLGNQLQSDQDKANAENEARYKETLGINAQSKQDQLGALSGGYGDVYGAIAGNKGEQMGFLDQNLAAQQGLTANFGNTAHERENRRLAGQNANSTQSAVGRGLGNSTVLDSLLRNNATDSAFVQNSIDEDTSRLRLGIQQDYGRQGSDVLGRNGAADVAARLGYANQVPDIINREDAQRINLITNRTDEGPDVNAYTRLLQQPGAQGGYGYGGGGNRGGHQRGFFEGQRGGGGGGQEFDPIAFLQQYMGASGYGGGQQQGGGGNEYVDQSTIDANRRVRAQGNSRLYNSSYGYGA